MHCEKRTDVGFRCPSALDLVEEGRLTGRLAPCEAIPFVDTMHWRAAVVKLPHRTTEPHRPPVDAATPGAPRTWFSPTSPTTMSQQTRCRYWHDQRGARAPRTTARNAISRTALRPRESRLRCGRIRPTHMVTRRIHPNVDLLSTCRVSPPDRRRHGSGSAASVETRYRESVICAPRVLPSSRGSPVYPNQIRQQLCLHGEAIDRTEFRSFARSWLGG